MTEPPVVPDAESAIPAEPTGQGSPGRAVGVEASRPWLRRDGDPRN